MPVYVPSGRPLVSSDCPTCLRPFALLANRCQDHCSPSCCSKARKPRCRFTPPYRSSSSVPPRRCRVCHAPESAFEPFPSNSFLLDHYPDPSYPPLQVFQHPNSGIYYFLDAVRPRIHRLYCSLRCYCNPDAGHYYHARGGKLIRQHRYNDRHGHMPREIRRWWREEKAKKAEHERILARWAEEAATLESDLIVKYPRKY